MFIWKFDSTGGQYFTRDGICPCSSTGRSREHLYVCIMRQRLWWYRLVILQQSMFSWGCHHIIQLDVLDSFRCKTTTLIFLSFTFCHRLLSGCLAALKTNLNSLIVIGEKNHIPSNNFINEWHCMQLWKMKPVMSVIWIFDNILIILRRRLLWVQKKFRFYNSLWEDVHAERETGNVIENLTHTHCHILFCKLSHLQPHMFTFIN